MIRHTNSDIMSAIIDNLPRILSPIMSFFRKTGSSAPVWPAGIKIDVAQPVLKLTECTCKQRQVPKIE